jgi:hypothetical protein
LKPFGTAAVSGDIWQSIIRQLSDRGIRIDPGLTDAEVSRAEEQFRFQFPPDLREFLQSGLPHGDGFPDWRSETETALRDSLRLPREGVLFDIAQNGFWLPEWGPRPATLADALRVAGELLSDAPTLIPIYRHRMIPDAPQCGGNPVFSVHQTDIIYYGFDLVDYFRHEFDLPGRQPWSQQIRKIQFWDIDRFQEVRWAGGPCVFDNRRGILP